MGLDPICEGVAEYWKGSMGRSVFTERNYGTKFDMSRKRFENIRACLRFTTKAGEGEERADPWRPIRLFFNLNRNTRIRPGRFLTVDEIMSFWLGADRQFSAYGVPHLTKIARKPRGIGAELKVICDGESNIMLRLKICEERVRQANKEYYAEYGRETIEQEGRLVTEQYTKRIQKSSVVEIMHKCFSVIDVHYTITTNSDHLTCALIFENMYLDNFTNLVLQT